MTFVFELALIRCVHITDIEREKEIKNTTANIALGDNR